QEDEVVRRCPARMIADDETGHVTRDVAPADELRTEVAVDRLREREDLFDEDRITLKRPLPDPRIERLAQTIEDIRVGHVTLSPSFYRDRGPCVSQVDSRILSQIRAKNWPLKT